MQKRNIRKNEPLDDEMQTAKPSMFKDAVTLLLEENVFTPTEFMNELEISGLAMNYKEVEILLDLPKDTLKPITTETDNNKVVFLKDFLKA